MTLAVFATLIPPKKTTYMYSCPRMRTQRSQIIHRAFIYGVRRPNDTSVKHNKAAVGFLQSLERLYMPEQRGCH